MKFSYTLLKYLSKDIKNSKELEGLLTDHLFEVEGVEGKTMDISVLPNRFSDAASHLGLVAELMAIRGDRFNWPESGIKLNQTGEVKITVKDRGACRRYMGVVVELGKAKSDGLIKKTLEEVGAQSINIVVDIINFVMYLTGQPLHAFDVDKVRGGVTVRRAGKGEVIVTLDGQKVILSEEMLVIADEIGPLALAGIKGGERAAVDKNTKRILIEAANFEQSGVFKTSRLVGIQTEASNRFSHNLSPNLVELGMAEVLRLFKKNMSGRVMGGVDIYSKKEKPRRIVMESDYGERLTGMKIGKDEVVKILRNLNFGVKEKKGRLMVAPPGFRTDIEGRADLVEEVIRIKGVSRVPVIPPVVTLKKSPVNEAVVMKGKMRMILTGLGFDEVYTYSFNGEGNEALAFELANPISEERRWLRRDLNTLLKRVAIDNFRWMDTVRVFEIGRIFKKEGKAMLEEESLSIAVAGEKGGFREVRGVIETMLRKLGITEFEMREGEGGLVVMAGREYLGVIKSEQDINWAELSVGTLVRTAEEDRDYEEIIKYPSIVRDISVLVEAGIRVGEILSLIQSVDQEEIRDVDLIDMYEGENIDSDKKSITFRIRLQSGGHSMTDGEADKIIDKIKLALNEKMEVGWR